MTNNHQSASVKFSEGLHHVDYRNRYQTQQLPAHRTRDEDFTNDSLVSSSDGRLGRIDNSQNPTPDLIRRSSILEDDEQQPNAAVLAIDAGRKYAAKNEPVTWMSLPKKGQLAVLTLARLSEPLSERSLAAYMFYQLRSFDPTLPDSTITSQGGMLTAAFAAAQFVTAVWWGRAADSPRIGRKKVILIGLFGTALATVGVGFSTSFTQALVFRLFAGALNGNIGVMRTMISEMIKERRFQSRAFLLLPMCFNIGVVIGPILGGFLADPIVSFPNVFGPGSTLGGKEGIRWMKAFPYALPNVVSGIFIGMSALGVILGLDETHKMLRHRPDWGRRAGKHLVRVLFRKRDSAYDYRPLHHNETELQQTPMSAATETAEDNEHSARNDQTLPNRSLTGNNHTHSSGGADLEYEIESKPKPQSPFRQILTRNVLLTLLSHHLMALHVSTFNALIFLFLPSPRSPASSASISSSFTLRFTGGLGLSTSKVGLATAIIGVIGFPLQILLYPTLNQILGTLRSYRTFLPFSVIAYTFLPFLALIPESRSYLIWPCLTVVLAAQVLSRTFALPSTVILVNNSSPNPDVLGTVHGVAQSVSSAARMLGPTVGGWGLGKGLEDNCVGAVWWAMAGVVGLNWSLLWFIFEGNGKGGKAS